MRLLALYTFQQEAGLFGRRAQAWNAAPEATRLAAGGVPGGGVMVLSPLPPDNGLAGGVWQSRQGDLPQAAVNGLSWSGDRLYAATAEGLYASPLTGARPVSKMNVRAGARSRRKSSSPRWNTKTCLPTGSSASKS